MINRKSIFLLFCGVFLLFSLILLAYFILLSFGGEDLENSIDSLWGSFKRILLKNGLFLFLAISILPGFVLPVAPLLTLAGLWAEQHGAWTACFFCVLSLIANLSWTYWLARGPARSALQKFLNRTKFKLPKTPPPNLLQWAMILRLTPGVPFIFSNYGLGILQMPFLQYLLISVPIIGVTACGYVLTFAGIFGGDWTYLWMGICLIVIMIIIGKMTLKSKKDADRII